MAQLSGRLEAILQLVQPCALLADVCSDHGLVPIAAVQRELAARAIAADLREAPLRLARQNIAAFGVADRVSLVQGDGLAPLAGRGVDAVVMAGVSARLMMRLCEAAPAVLAGVRQLVVQPNSDAPALRAWARVHGWHLRDERMVDVGGRFFVVCALEPGVGEDPAYALPGWPPTALTSIGPWLIARRDPVARRWCAAQHARLAGLVGAAPQLGPALAMWHAACAGLAT
jgi:tRNA (adenine22-N1)-methyltransferase